MSAPLFPNPTIMPSGFNDDKKSDKKFAKVMKEYSKSVLHSGSGDIVKNPKQAQAIAFSESKKDYRMKQADRKNADRYGIGKKK